MWRVMAAGAALFAGGCANASADAFDASDPVHCMVIFGVAVNGARQVGQEAAARDFERRATMLARVQGGAKWVRQITPRSLEVGARMEAAADERATMALLDACIARQDGDPHRTTW